MRRFGAAHTYLWEWMCTVLSSLLFALSLNLFLMENNIAAGGLSGIAVALRSILPLSMGKLLLLMNIHLLLLCIFVKGWRFSIKTILCTLAFTAFTEYTAFLPTVTHNPLMASIFGGAINGAGMVLLSLGNSSVGGTDLINRIIVTFFPNVSVGKMSIAVDGGVVIFAMAVFRNIEVGLYAIVAIYICSTVLDTIMLGFDRGNLCVIVTGRPAIDIASPLMESLERAVTKLDGQGMYTLSSRSVLLMTIRPSETAKLKRILSALDPDAFMVVVPAGEVLGGNFKALNGKML